MLNEMQFLSELSKVKDIVFRFALKLTGNHQDAQDLWQESCIRAYRYKDKFERDTNFKAWLSTIMRNSFSTNYRKRKRRRKVSEPIESFSYALESTNLVPNEGEANLRIQFILDLLDQLNKIYRIPFLMHYQGFNYQEIAEYLHVPMGTIKSRIFTARKQLKKAIISKEGIYCLPSQSKS